MDDSSLSINTLPQELFGAILALLSHEQLVSLMSVSKDFQKRVEPFIWVHIDLFNERYRTICNMDEPPSKYAAPPRRTSREGNSTECVDDCQRRAASWFTKLVESHQERAVHTQQFCTYTRSLTAPICLSKGSSPGLSFDRIWAILPHFVNLERLDLVVDWQPGSEKPLDISSFKPLAKLSSVKLYDYVPLDFVHYILLSAPTLESLDVGLLDELTPGSNFESVRAASPLSMDLQQSSLNIEDLIEYEDNVAPESLSWVPDTVPSLPRLTHLRLCRPTEMDPAEFSWGRIHHSRSSQETCLDGWARLLNATRSSIQHLYIDQRPVAHEDALEGADNDEHMKFYSQPSSQKLAEMILDVLPKSDFPCLRRIDFAGVFVNVQLSASDKRLRKELIEMCQLKNIECRFPLSKRCIFETENGEVYATDGMGAECREEE